MADRDALIGCLYVAHYPAWAVRRGRGTRQPVVVVASGRVVAASRRPRRKGVARGMSARRAGELAGEKALRQREAGLEQAVWERVLRALNRLTPRIESPRPGRAYFQEVSESEAEPLARRLRARVGRAPYRGAARLAALRAGRGHVLTVGEEHLTAFLKRFPTGRLVEVGFEEELTEQLQLFGYDTLGDALALSRLHLEAQFGQVGERLYRLLHPPEDERPVAICAPPPRVALAWDLEPGEAVPAAVGRLAGEAARRLDGRACQQVTLRLTCRRAGTLTRTRRLREPRRSAASLRRVAETLLRQLRPSAQAVRTVRLTLGALRAPETKQGALFERRPHVRRAIEAVQQRYPDALKRATIRPEAPFLEERAELVPIALGDP